MKKPISKVAIRQSRIYFKTIGKFKASRSNTIFTSFRVFAPKQFSIMNAPDRKLIISMINNIRASIRAGKKVVIDFSKTKVMVADGALYFYAEIMRLIDLFPNAINKIRSTLPRENRVTETLEQIGLLKILSPMCNTTPTRPDVINWRAAHGCLTDGESYDIILSDYQGKITEALQDKLYNGITEAMTNSTQHAYIMPRADYIKTKDSYKPWWMFSQEKDGFLMVVFCDLGVGIPETLPRTRPALWKKMLEEAASKVGISNKPKDSKVIREAVEYGRTRTHLPNRGKGLHQMVDLVSGHEGGTCVINSNKGCYVLKDGKESFYDYQNSIMGTLIFWKVPVAKADQ